MLGTAYFLLGDRAPRDSFIADALRERIGHHFACWIDQQHILLPDGRCFRRFTPRFRAFEAFIARQPNRGPTVIFGRSSGARVASYYACRRTATIAVCLGYPFRVPGRSKILPGTAIWRQPGHPLSSSREVRTNTEELTISWPTLCRQASPFD